MSSSMYAWCIPLLLPSSGVETTHPEWSTSSGKLKLLVFLPAEEKADKLVIRIQHHLPKLMIRYHNLCQHRISVIIWYTTAYGNMLQDQSHCSVFTFIVSTHRYDTNYSYGETGESSKVTSWYSSRKNQHKEQSELGLESKLCPFGILQQISYITLAKNALKDIKCKLCTKRTYVSSELCGVLWRNDKSSWQDTKNDKHCTMLPNKNNTTDNHMSRNPRIMSKCIDASAELEHTREGKRNFQLSCQCFLTSAVIPTVVRLPQLQDILKMPTEPITIDQALIRWV